MKSIAGVVVLLVMVAAVAVSGSQAQPLPGIHPVLRACRPRGPMALESLRCRPVVLLAAPAELERDFAGDLGGELANAAGGPGADPDWQVQAVKAFLDVAWKAAVAAASANFVQRALDWALGDNVADNTTARAYLDTSIFDPTQ